jgi:hypothetical protein
MRFLNFERRNFFMGMLGSLKNFIVGAPGAPAAGGQPAPTIVRAVPNAKMITSTMDQEQLRSRRINLIEGTKFGRPAHESIMLFFLRIWLVIAPVLFVILTSSEVAYILTHLVPPGDKNGQTIIWGGVIFIDVAMMFCTFGVAIKRRDVAEKRETVGVVSKREEFEMWFGTCIWLVFATINIISQAAFLLHIVQVSGTKDLNIIYLFIASRVVGFILGDASTAFFLAKVDGNNLKLIARSEREKAGLYRDIATAEGERKVIEEQAEADILIVQIEVQQKREEAEFMAALKRQMFTDILERRNALPPASRSTVRRLDTGS